jgi:cation:H+ antiporter
MIGRPYFIAGLRSITVIPGLHRGSMSSEPLRPKHLAGNFLSLGLAVLACLGWLLPLALGIFHYHGPYGPIVALLAGVAILGAAFMLSWGVEVAELDLPTALAVSILALIAVLPEYAVDATFAWKAAHDPEHAGYAIANMTGGNRLVLGIGWPLLVFLAWVRFGRPGIRLPRSVGSDVAILLLASLYAIVPLVRRSLTLMDTAVLVSFYALYVVAAYRSTAHGEEEEDDDLVGPAALLASLRPGLRRLSVTVLFIWAAGVICIAAEPFAQSLVETGETWGINKFLLVQWVAPLASEAPEFIVASILVVRGSMVKGMMALISSGVNQWTVLVGTLPVVTSLSAGRPAQLAMDVRQHAEVLLTAAQCIFGVAVLADRMLTRAQATLLALLFVAQLFVPDPAGREVFAYAYLVAAAGILVAHRASRNGLLDAFHAFWSSLRGKPVAED